MGTTHINKTHTPKGLWVKLCLANLTIVVKHKLTTFVKHKLTMFVKHLTIIVKHWLTIFVNNSLNSFLLPIYNYISMRGDSNLCHIDFCLLLGHLGSIGAWPHFQSVRLSGATRQCYRIQKASWRQISEKSSGN